MGAEGGTEKWAGPSLVSCSGGSRQLGPEWQEEFNNESSLQPGPGLSSRLGQPSWASLCPGGPASSGDQALSESQETNPSNFQHFSRN